MKALCFLLLVTHAALAQKTVQVRVNKNVELINLLAVQNTPDLLKDTLTNPWLKENSILMRQSFQQFRQVTQHPIFRTYQHLEDSLGTGTYLLALYYGDVPNARRHTDLPLVITRAISPNHDSVVHVIDRFFVQLSKFYNDIRFDKFLTENQHVYKQASAEVSRNLPDLTYIPALETYYGTTKHSYNIVVNPFFQSRWGMGWETTTKTGTDIYNIASPFDKASLAENGRVISPGFDNRTEIRRLSVHEFGHSFVNPLANRPEYRAQIEEFNDLYEPIKGDIQYDNWHTQFCEYVVRAGEVRIAVAMRNAADAKAVETKNVNWRYLSHFTHQLEQYEQNRKQYPTFASFLPVLIQSLAELKK